MKISTTTIAAFLSIAGTTCGVNAGAMTALTNHISRLQAQERRRHLEDFGFPCVEEQSALVTCSAANPDACPVEDANLRKLGRESRSGRSYSLSNGHHGRHLEDSSDCSDYQSEICVGLALYPSCPCVDEYLTFEKCDAKEQGLLCDDLADDVCGAIPCLEEQTLSYQCFADNADSCALFLEPERRRRLDEGDFTCVSFEEGLCSSNALFGNCPCVDEYNANLACEVEANGLVCTPPTQEKCDELLPCLEEDVLVTQCFTDNAELCAMNMFEDGPERRRHLDELDDAFSCESYESTVCLFPVLFPSCPCLDELNASNECKAEENGLVCTPPTQETCDAYSCLLCLPYALCFDSTGYCSYDEGSKLWSGAYEECNGDADGSAALCAKCFPDAQCVDGVASEGAAPSFSPSAAPSSSPTGSAAPSFSPSAAPSSSPTGSAAPSFSPSAAPSSSPSAPSAGITSFKSLGTFMIVTVVSVCFLFM